MIFVLADDLSGAAELANEAAQHGFTAEVQLEFDASSSADVVCINMDSRRFARDAAMERVARFGQAVLAASPREVFFKCDSLLRGHVAEESRVIAEILGRSTRLLVPANPSRGRTIERGIYLVDGVPLHESPLASDPEYPRHTGNVRALLGAEESSVQLPDVRTASEVIEAVRGLGRATLPVGAADFFRAFLLGHRRADRSCEMVRSGAASSGTTLLVCGSAAAWRLGRAEEAATHQMACVSMPESLFGVEVEPAALAKWVQWIRAALTRDRQIMMAIGNARAPEVSERDLLSRFAGAASDVLAQTAVDRLGLEGGATAMAVIEALGWKRFSVVCACPSGMAWLLPWGCSGPNVLIKPGSYRWPEEFWRDAVERSQ